jgi:hypothetical protein
MGENNAVFKAIVENVVHEDPSNVMINHLDLLKSEAALRNIIDSWCANGEVNCFILVVDMQHRASSNLSNFVRSYIEHIELPTLKKFLLMLHYPLSVGRPNYPALFLGNWQCMYLDGIGYRDSLGQLSVNSIFEASCFNQQLNTNPLDALLPKAIQYVASQCRFYSNSTHPASVNREMQFVDRHTNIEATLERILSGKSLASLLGEKYMGLWTKRVLDSILSNAAHGLQSNTTHLSLSTAIRSVFQHTFNKFLAHSISEINVWGNLDVLCDTSFDSEMESIFSLVVNVLPSPPLNELELQRDVYRHLDPLPLDLVDEADALFPFYRQVSSFIDAALDVAIASSSDGPALSCDAAFDFEEIIMKVEEHFLAESESSMSTAVKNIIRMVDSSDELYERYTKHHVLWKFGAKGSQVIQWISHKIQSTELSISYRNIVLLHLFCRRRGLDIMRISSWSMLSVTEEHTLKLHSAEDVGTNFISSMLERFKSIIEQRPTETWSRSFSAFLLSIPSMLEQGELITDKSAISAMRYLIFINTIVTTEAPEGAAPLLVEQASNLVGHSLKDFFLLLDKHDDSNTWILDVKRKLMRVLFSEAWLKTVLDRDNADANFLIGSISSGHIEHQTGVVHLRSLLLHSSRIISKGTMPFYPLHRFCQPMSLLICRKLSCQGTGDFFPATDQRTKMPHYIPQWLRGNNANSSGDDDKDMAWYFQNYRHDFDCPLADVVFDIMLSLLAQRMADENCSSEHLLLVFQEKITSHVKNK